jgi:hypothetical protein
VSSVQPGDLLALDRGRPWIVLAVDGTRALLADPYDDLRGCWFDVPNEPRILSDGEVVDYLQRDSQLAASYVKQAEDHETSARWQRESAARFRLRSELIERLRAARGSR